MPDDEIGSYWDNVDEEIRGKVKKLEEDIDGVRRHTTALEKKVDDTPLFKTENKIKDIKGEISSLRDDHNKLKQLIPMEWKQQFFEKDILLLKEILQELFQRMGDNEDLSNLGFDLLEKLDAKDGDSKDNWKELALRKKNMRKHLNDGEKSVGGEGDRQTEETPSKCKHQFEIHGEFEICSLCGYISNKRVKEPPEDKFVWYNYTYNPNTHYKVLKADLELWVELFDLAKNHSRAESIREKYLKV